jgi:hypothetical protein
MLAICLVYVVQVGEVALGGKHHYSTLTRFIFASGTTTRRWPGPSSLQVLLLAANPAYLRYKHATRR